MTPAVPYLRRAATVGMIGGIVLVFLGLIGMIQAFSGREVVTGYVTLGRVVMVLVVLLFAWNATRTTAASATVPSRDLRLIAGALTGALGGAVTALFLLIAENVDLTPVLQSVSGRLLQTMSFRLDLAPAIVLLTIGGAVLGVLAAGLHLLPRILQRAVVAGAAAVLLVSLMEPLLRVMLVQLKLTAAADFLYQRGGLTLPAALLVFVLVAGANGAWRRRGAAVRERVEGLPAGQHRVLTFAVLAVVGVLLLALPQIVGPFLSEVLGTVGVFILLGLGLNIVVGFAGLLDLGYVAFYAVGAYTTAVLTSLALDSQLNFWVALPLVVAVAAIAGLMIGAPVLRLRGDYLAIVTLGFGEIARILALSDWLSPLLGGAQGVLNIPAPTIFGIALRDPQTLYYLILLFCIIAAAVALSLANSRVGRAWNAMREDEQVAEATGINTTNYKLLAFAIGAVFGCLAGALFAVKIGSVFAQSFPLLVSITALALIILGGMGSILGVIVGALVLVGLPELLREFAEFRLLIYGAVLVAMMLLRPEGLVPSATRRRELHEDEPPEEQYESDAGKPSGAPVITAGGGA